MWKLKGVLSEEWRPFSWRLYRLVQHHSTAHLAPKQRVAREPHITEKCREEHTCVIARTWNVAATVAFSLTFPKGCFAQTSWKNTNKAACVDWRKLFAETLLSRKWKSFFPVEAKSPTVTPHLPRVNLRLKPVSLDGRSLPWQLHPRHWCLVSVYS